MEELCTYEGSVEGVIFSNESKKVEFTLFKQIPPFH